MPAFSLRRRFINVLTGQNFTQCWARRIQPATWSPIPERLILPLSPSLRPCFTSDLFQARITLNSFSYYFPCAPQLPFIVLLILLGDCVYRLHVLIVVVSAPELEKCRCKLYASAFTKSRPLPHNSPNSPSRNVAKVKNEWSYISNPSYTFLSDTEQF